jgi:LPS-assembly lipoprotein
MNRRVWLGQCRTGLATTGLAALLAGCGFKLRGAQNFAFDTISVVAAQNGPVAAELRRALGDRLVAIAPAPATSLTHVTMDLVQELREKTVVGVNAAGQVREFQLRIRVRFRLRGANDKMLIEESEILQQRDITFNESAVLAKEVEEGLLYRDMQSDIVQQVMRRLAAVKSLG